MRVFGLFVLETITVFMPKTSLKFEKMQIRCKPEHTFRELTLMKDLYKKLAQNREPVPARRAPIIPCRKLIWRGCFILHTCRAPVKICIIMYNVTQIGT